MTVRTGPTCSRCGDRLDSLLVDRGGVHIVCCDSTCPAWPCDGTHMDTGR